MEKEEIIRKIIKNTNYTEEEIRKKVEEKMKIFKGLISEEGAYILVAKDLGVKIYDVIKKYLKIKDIIGGMKNISFIGRIFKISEIREFEFNGKFGKVVNLYIGDETGYVKMPLWNDEVKLIEENKIRVDDVIEFTNVFSKENVFGDIEISRGKFGSFKIIEDKEELPKSKELLNLFFAKNYKKVKISEISGIGNYEIEGTIIKVYKNKKFVFEVCPICNVINCIEHLSPNPNYTLIFTCIIDDGYGNMRISFFRDNALKLANVEIENIKGLNNDEIYKILKKNVLAKEIKVKGSVRKNKIFDMLEMICNEFSEDFIFTHENILL